MPKDKTLTHALIVRHMRDEFLAHGYSKASLNRVAARVGVTTAGLYRHFKDKEDMFRSLVQGTLDDFRAAANVGQAQAENTAGDNPFDADWAGSWTDFVYDHYDGMKLLLCCSEGSPFASFEEDVIQAEAEGNRRYAQALQEQGRPVKNVTDLQWHMLATAYVHLLFETVRHDMPKDQAVEHARFVRELFYPGWRQMLGV